MALARKGIRWDLLSAVFWGCIFVVQNAAMDRDPFVTAAMLAFAGGKPLPLGKPVCKLPEAEVQEINA